MIRKTIFGLAVAGMMAIGGQAMAADTFPSRPMTLVVPYEPGSTVDTTSRMVADQLSRKLGQPVVVENRTGGYGMIAMNALLNAPADGHTLMVDTPAIAINPSIYQVRYDPLQDLEPVAQLMSLPFVVVANPDVPATTMQEFVALAKKQPGELNIAPGGTSTLLAGELLGLRTDIDLQNINYKGASSAIMAVLRNECQVAVFDVANLAPQISAGKLRGLLITGDKRSAAIPDVPTAAEAGVPDFNVSTWFGIFTNKGTPPEVIEKLNSALLEVFQQPAYQQYLEGRGASTTPLTANQFKTFFHSEVALWADVVKTAGVKFE